MLDASGYEGNIYVAISNVRFFTLMWHYGDKLMYPARRGLLNSLLSPLSKMPLEKLKCMVQIWIWTWQQAARFKQFSKTNDQVLKQQWFYRTCPDVSLTNDSWCLVCREIASCSLTSCITFTNCSRDNFAKAIEDGRPQCAVFCSRLAALPSRVLSLPSTPVVGLQHFDIGYIPGVLPSLRKMQMYIVSTMDPKIRTHSNICQRIFETSLSWRVSVSTS